MDVTIDQRRQPRPVGSSRDWPLILFAATMPVAVVAYLIVGWRLPLWFDEVFTGTIASQPSFNQWLAWCLSELSGPAFYGPMWLWTKVAGDSDTALRLPILAAAVATPLLIAWRGHPDRDVRLYWASLTALWLPMAAMATEARPYPLLVLLCTWQAIAFVAVAREARMGRAFAWTTASALAVLTHYYAATMLAFQGLALIAIHRRAVLRLVPALLPLVIAGVWIAYHLRFLIGFAAGHVATYNPIPPMALLATPNFLFGPGLQGIAILALIVFTRPIWWDRATQLTPESALAWSGVAAFVMIIAAGLWRATLQPRYLTPTVPALLFGIACWAKIVRPVQPKLALAGFAALFAAMLAAPWLLADDDRIVHRRDFQFETAAAWLGEGQIERLHFLWSTPTGAQSDSPRLAEVAGFFFRRAGRSVQVMVSRGGVDPSRALLAEAGADRHAGILWVSDNDLPKGVHPQVEAIDPRWQCRQFGSSRFLIYACRPKTGA